MILPQWHIPNAATRILSLCQKRLQADWMRHFHHPLLLLETFADPQHFHGTIYRAANWTLLGSTKGFRRASAQGYQPNASPKLVFVYALQRNAQHILSQSYLNPGYQCGIPKLMLSANQMNALPAFFKSIPDPRRTQGRRHRLNTILAIATGAILCGRVGYKGIAEWAQSLSQDARTRFQCYYKQGRYHFIVKANQPRLFEDLQYHFRNRQAPDALITNYGHGRIETRKIWVTRKLNDYLDFPYVGQAFAIERESIDKKTKKVS